MLRELYELSQNVNATLPPVGYGVLVAHVEVNIANSSLIISSILSSNAKKEYLGKRRVLPDIVRSSNAANRPLPVADKGKFILGIGKDGGLYHRNYLALLKECLEFTQDEAVAATLKTVESLTVERVRSDCSPWLDKDKSLEDARFIFLYDGQLITERLCVKNFWAQKFMSININGDKEKRKSEKSKKVGETAAPIKGQCSIIGSHLLLCGETLPVKIKGVPGSQDGGAALVSFNFESVESHQWKDSEHAPIGFDVAERSHQMLNKLLQEERHSYHQGKTAFVYWGEYDTGLNPLIWEQPDELWDDDSAAVAQTIFTASDNPKGFSAADCQSTQFYLAILTGCEGRVAISRWDETTPQKIADNVTRYIETQKSIPGDKYKARPVWQLAGSCFRDPSKDHLDPVVRALVMNALWGAAIPQSMISKVLDRIHLDLFAARNADKKDMKTHESRYYSRFQILALYKNSMTTQSPEMLRRLQIAQHLGAIAYLMHIAEIAARNLYLEKEGKNNKIWFREDHSKTGVAASLRALSSTPKSVFGRLYQNAILYHLPVSCTDGKSGNHPNRRYCLGRAGILLKEEFGKLVEMQLSPETDLPTTFSLDESAWFYMGWGLREATFREKSEGGGDPEPPELNQQPSTELIETEE